MVDLDVTNQIQFLIAGLADIQDDNTDTFLGQNLKRLIGIADFNEFIILKMNTANDLLTNLVVTIHNQNLFSIHDDLVAAEPIFRLPKKTLSPVRSLMTNLIQLLI